MEETMEETKKPIAPTLRKMGVGEAVHYPRTQYTSLLVTIQRMHYTEDKRWSARRCKDGVWVTRTE